MYVLHMKVSRYNTTIHMNIHTYVQYIHASSSSSSSDLSSHRYSYYIYTQVHIYTCSVHRDLLSTSPRVRTRALSPQPPCSCLPPPPPPPPPQKKLLSPLYESTRFHLASRRALTHSRSSHRTRLVLHVLCTFLPWRMHETRHMARLQQGPRTAPAHQSL